MKTEEFDNMKFSGGMKVLHRGKEYDIFSVDFEEKLIGIQEFESDDEISWKRCENCEIVK